MKTKIVFILNKITLTYTLTVLLLEHRMDA